MWAKIENNIIVKYPYSERELRLDNPGVSFKRGISAIEAADYGVINVVATAPIYDKISQSVEEGLPIFTNNRWEQYWVVADKDISALSQEKEKLVQRIKVLRIQKTESGFTFAGKRVPTDKEALVLVDAALAYTTKKPDKVIKRAGLGSFDKDALDMLQEAIGDFMTPIFNKESDLYDLIMAATTWEQLRAIDINSGW